MLCFWDGAPTTSSVVSCYDVDRGAATETGDEALWVARGTSRVVRGKQEVLLSGRPRHAGIKSHF